MTSAAAIERAQSVARRHRDRQAVPGVIWALLHDGVVVHVEGDGDAGSGRAPDVGTIFRIASMTKSFTAATVLILRDRGLLRLDDSLVDHLPWTSSIGAPDSSAPITLRDLLTMAAGFPTDDPWGDRQESLLIADFDSLIAGGLSFSRPPRMGWEYSNLGYALLGRVISAVTNDDYTAVVHRELLEPLAMTSTGFDPRLLPSDRRAVGHHPHGEELQREEIITPGAFSPMGGLLSSIGDLALWVGGFQESWRGSASGSTSTSASTATSARSHPLSLSSRREMQEPLRLARTELTVEPGPPVAVTTCYGFGLAVEERSDHGRFIHHSGGYPGFGSHMRWHPSTGWGVIALGNRTYARMQLMATDLLNAVVAETGDVPADTSAPEIPRDLWPVTWEAIEAVDSLLDHWDDALADRWFAMNMDLDQSRALRRTALDAAIGSIGRSTRGAVTSRTPAHARWERHGTVGSLSIEILMSPTMPPLIQALTVSPLSNPR